MSFNYHQLEDDSIEHIGSVQEQDPGTSNEDQTICPTRPLLPRWPLCVGVCEIVVGFICAGLGAVNIFVIPFLVNIDAVWFLNPLNSYGAALWSGLTLVIAGSLAVRVSKFRTLLNVQLFYVVTALAFLVNLGLMILIMWSYMKVAFYSSVGAKSLCEEFWSLCPTIENLVEQIDKYSPVALISYVFCLLGCLLLAITTSRYFMSVMFGEVQFVKSLLICCCPCMVPYCKLPPSKASSNQSMDNVEPNMIV